LLGLLPEAVKCVDVLVRLVVDKDVVGAVGVAFVKAECGVGCEGFVS
jgi:hypothetical protein